MSEPVTEHTCKSCGHIFSGNYCNLCGEKVLGMEDGSLKALIHNLVSGITFADNKVFKTIWLVIYRPGFLSSEYVAGRRVPYMKPLSLFFVLNLIYFLFPVIQLFNASLLTQLMGPQHRWASSIVTYKMMSLNIKDISSFSLLYNQKTTALAKLMVMIFVIVASLPLNLLYRNKNRVLSDHVTYMVELASFNLLINAIGLTLVVRLTGLGHYLDELVLTVFFITTNFYFLIRSGIQFYGQRGVKLILNSLIMLAMLKLALEIYRAILFYITLWTW